ncbi:MAG: 3-phosphoshikimate 1-carboxyvinyltransferase [Candidatus Merdivicinus sp.]|jgi:3-phosphoshikimate 1-carboxyvinyltransferase
MNLVITPRKLQGEVRVPASKSMAHRLLLCAAFAGEPSKLTGFCPSADMSATLNGLRALGAEAEISGDTVEIRPGMPSGGEIDCGESGSTLRFLIPPALARLSGEISFVGHGRLMERPLMPYLKLFAEKGIRSRQEGNRLIVNGRLSPGKYALSGKISSQFVTGLLFGLALLPEDSEIVITDRLESRAYVDLTLSALQTAGIRVENQAYQRFLIPGGQKFHPVSGEIEGDWSQAAFFLGANFLGCEIRPLGLKPDSLQGDRAVSGILAQMKESGCLEVDASEIPDLIPALAAAAAGRKGGSVHFINAGRLRMKESDRIASTANLIRSLGGKAAEGADDLEITGTGTLSGGTVDCANDHRIAMAAAELSGICENPVTLLGAECVRKSYPAFWEDFARLGGKAEQA